MITELFRTESQWCPELCVAFREERARRHHANHCIGFVIQRDALADDAHIAAKPPLPQFVAEQHYMVFARSLFFRKKVTPQYGLNPKQSEDVRREPRAGNVFGLAFSGQDKPVKASRGEPFKRGALFPPLIERRRGHPILV